ncbi:MAG: hypothetical protein B7Z60_04550 [Ferrovum sp. 37-45-19]|jgi:membrane-associated protease RseP (regulator of RpoE activity)|uniref:DUF4337 domain-containing protein n=1 Tax=Ferrovum sp. JA12 TaxID=1356299 RepID=UPI0007032C8C|nr:DUF4337 domain-containing protein [Ferrovum sp. JA12]OYV80180.1 MAG: hypothetical protein B7Z65_02325 [Ferrovum sp. 21-44-67]OYV94457.1 MAG: hypothetical protein B7Z60_04550 [Ferrovum sp. 37-45-19]OZB32440.1 MAG: hypothetical protein B7X47_06315 [Ferrovum sp. 34-44-207]HQT81646.1 DUF4337 domain-containing protein [Ferrovaceae bacterium]KRH78859.1 hypothetical protein FERRO_18570 [Ferrovum sp. JA12]
MEDEFHVHGSHEHELEHQAGHGIPLAQQVAVFTAILASVGAVVSYLGSTAQNEALFHKNEAVLLKAHASDQWSYYQAKSMKGNLVSIAQDFASGASKIKYQNEAIRYEKEKALIKEKAESFESRSEEENKLAEKAFHPHHYLARAMTFLQIAIALASVTVLTNRKWLLIPTGIGAVIGITLAFMAYL